MSESQKPTAPIFKTLTGALSARKDNKHLSPYKVKASAKAKTIYVLATSPAAALSLAAREHGWECSLVNRQELLDVMAGSTQPVLPGMNDGAVTQSDLAEIDNAE